MAKSTLEQAKAKFEEASQLLEEQAPSSTDKDAVFALYEGKVGDALYTAQEALVALRREGDADGKVSALETVVQCNLALTDTFAALLAAKDELAMLRRTVDNSSLAKVMDIVQRVHSVRGEAHAALETVEELVALQKELGDLAGEAKALRVMASLKLEVGRKNEAIAPAHEALKIYRELGLKDGELAAQRTVSSVCTARGVVDKAPNRQEALDALASLAAAVDACDQEAWNAALKVLNQTCAYTQKDVDDVMKRALERDPRAARKFLAEQGIGPSKEASTGEFHITEVYKKATYLNFRLGGLAYGPRFRCLQGHKFMSKGDPSTVGTAAVLQVQEEAQDWEGELAFNPGVLDGLLQSLSCMST